MFGVFILIFSLFFSQSFPLNRCCLHLFISFFSTALISKSVLFSIVNIFLFFNYHFFDFLFLPGNRLFIFPLYCHLLKDAFLIFLFHHNRLDCYFSDRQSYAVFLKVIIASVVIILNVGFSCAFHSVF